MCMSFLKAVVSGFSGLLISKNSTLVLGLFLTCLLAYHPVRAQSDAGTTLSGTVLNDLNGDPLSEVNVFIAHSMLGTTTDENGKFHLTKIPRGTYELVVSRLGFGVKKLAVRLVYDTEKSFDIRLTPIVLQGPEIQVTSTRLHGWKKQLKEFEDFFLGTSRNASKCKIVNPEVLEFRTEKSADNQAQVFTATASDILLIENKALGYRVFYLLESFQHFQDMIGYIGKTHFEELHPKNDKEMRKWLGNRLKTYNGSLRHFLALLTSQHAAMSGYLEKQGFLVYELESLPSAEHVSEPSEGRLANYISQGELPFERKLHFFNFLQVIYTREFEDRRYIYWRLKYDRSALRMNNQKWSESTRPQAQTSWLVMNKTFATIDTSGYLYDPLALTVYGYWAWENVADLLPIEYSPQEGLAR